jgi:hypothetical protein
MYEKLLDSLPSILAIVQNFIISSALFWRRQEQEADDKWYTEWRLKRERAETSTCVAVSGSSVVTHNKKVFFPFSTKFMLNCGAIFHPFSFYSRSLSLSLLFLIKAGVGERGCEGNF